MQLRIEILVPLSHSVSEFLGTHYSRILKQFARSEEGPVTVGLQTVIDQLLGAQAGPDKRTSSLRVCTSTDCQSVGRAFYQGSDTVLNVPIISNVPEPGVDIHLPLGTRSSMVMIVRLGDVDCASASLSRDLLTVTALFSTAFPVVGMVKVEAENAIAWAFLDTGLT